jgi:hypothetical protein
VKLTKDLAHSVQLKDGKNRCVRCKKVEPDLTKRCPKAGRLKPAGTGKGS